jgi:hypothetical protein
MTEGSMMNPASSSHTEGPTKYSHHETFARLQHRATENKIIHIACPETSFPEGYNTIKKDISNDVNTIRFVCMFCTDLQNEHI